MDKEAPAKSLDDPRATRSERITPEANAFESTTQSDIETAVVPVEVPVVDLQNKEGLLSKHKCNENGVPQFMFDAISSIALQLGFTPGLFQIKFDKGHDKPFDITWIIAEPWKATITEDDQTHILFCKVRPINEVTQKNVHTRKIFDREVDAYVKFLPTIYEFQRVKGITQDVGFFNAPRCYLAFNDKLENAAMIIMEDLHLNGYRTWNKQNPFDYDHARLLMVQLGRLHAVSLALKEQRPEVFEQFKILGTSVTDLKGNPSLLEMMRHELDRALATLEPHENRLRLKLLNLCSTLEDDLITITSPEFSEPYSVFGHGDCRANDPMFFYEQKSPVKIVLRDWQRYRYASPALDLLSFLFCCTDEPFRRVHYNEMIRFYYDSLRHLLQKLGGDADRQFPFEELLQQLQKCSSYILWVAAFAIPEVSARRQGGIQSPTDIYKKLMGDIIRDMERYGYLPEVAGACCEVS